MTPLYEGAMGGRCGQGRSIGHLSLNNVGYCLGLQNSESRILNSIIYLSIFVTVLFCYYVTVGRLTQECTARFKSSDAAKGLYLLCCKTTITDIVKGTTLQLLALVPI